MKKYFSVFVVCAFACAPAMAAVKMCVQNVATSTCTDAHAIGTNEWEMTCGGVKMYGLAYCAATARYAYGISDVTRKRVSSADVIATYDNANKYCWCSMVAPFRSNWYYATDVPKGASNTTADGLNKFSSAGDCNTQCATACVEFWSGNNSINLVNDEGVREHVFRFGVLTI